MISQWRLATTLVWEGARSMTMSIFKRDRMNGDMMKPVLNKWTSLKTRISCLNSFLVFFFFGWYRAEPAQVWGFLWDSFISSMTIYMNGDACPEWYSVPLASRNMGQPGLRHRLNTNKLWWRNPKNRLTFQEFTNLFNNHPPNNNTRW